MTWSIEDVSSQTGKVIVITGANAGLGFESAKALAGKGAEVILAVRTLSKGEDAAQQIRVAHPNAKVWVMELNLGDLSSVAAFVDTFKAKFDRLDVLINNAGVGLGQEGKTVDGFELKFGTNHLGHFALTGQLLDSLLATPNSRVVNVASVVAENARINFDDLMFEREYRATEAYAQSKLANLLFTLGLQQYFESVDADTIAVAAHPGVVMTQLALGITSNRLFRLILKWVARFFVSTPEVGAKPQIRAAIDPTVAGGDYYGPANGGPVKVPMPDSVNADDILKLWELSEQLTDVHYNREVNHTA